MVLACLSLTSIAHRSPPPPPRSRMVNYFFHKNIVFGLSIFYSNATSRFTGGMTYDEFYISIYNVIFTALPPVIVGIFDQDVPREACYRYPGLYRQGIDNHYFSIRARVGWTLSALAQSALVYYPAMACLNLVSAGSDGHAYSLWMTGITLFTCVIVTVHLQLIIGEGCACLLRTPSHASSSKHHPVLRSLQLTGSTELAALLHCHSPSSLMVPLTPPFPVLDFWNWLHHFSIWGSIIVWFIFLLIYGALPPGFTVTEHVWLMFREMVGPLPKNWFVVLCIPALAVFPEFFFRAVKRQMYPDDHHIVQEYLKVRQAATVTWTWMSVLHGVKVRQTVAWKRVLHGVAKRPLHRAGVFKVRRGVGRCWRGRGVVRVKVL